MWSLRSKEQVKGWSRIRPPLIISLFQLYITSQLWLCGVGWWQVKTLPGVSPVCWPSMHSLQNILEPMHDAPANRCYPWQRLDLSSSLTGGHSWEVMYTCSSEILKGGRILDQPWTCSLSKILVSLPTAVIDWCSLILNLTENPRIIPRD